MAYEINVRLLRDKINAIFDHILVERSVETVPIPPEDDFYWELPDDELFDVRRGPPVVENGRLSDDYEFLKSMDNREAFALMLIHAAPLLRYLAKKVKPF